MDNFISQNGEARIHQKEGYEESDLSIRGIVMFLVTLGFLGILTFVAARVLISDRPWVSLGWLEKKFNPPQPLTPAEQRLQDERAGVAAGMEARPAEGAQGQGPEWYGRGQMEERLKRTFPVPRLQYDDTYDMQTFRNSEDKWLGSTGRDAEGNIHIPVDRAMDLLVQRGLPQVSGPFVPPTLPSATPLVPAAQRSR
jgi:hypothetical protein